jgi:hypothetical protein
MKIGNVFASIVIGYLVIGGLIGLTQLAMTKLFEPPCNGTIVHTLWADFPQRLDDSEILAGKREESLIFGLVRGLAQWLPNLSRKVITGDMTVRDYLLGGYKCVATSPISWPKSITPLPESMK